MVVVFPAPLGPRKPNISPFFTSKLMWFTAVKSPNRLVKNLTKRFGDLTAVNHISFEVKKGEIFGFLGPNGAGKTTTIRMLTGLTEPSEGTARIMGHDIQKEPFRAKECFGIVPEVSNLYDDFSAWNNLISWTPQ